MKKVYSIIFFLLGFSLAILADNHCSAQRPHMTRQEFIKKKEAFLTKKAELSSEEAQAFFPVYKEFNKKKRELKNNISNLYKKGNSQDLTAKEYEEIINKIYDLRIETAQLDKTYLEKFKQILSCKKILKIQQAELKFHKNLIKEMHDSPKQSTTPHKHL